LVVIESLLLNVVYSAHIEHEVGRVEHLGVATAHDLRVWEQLFEKGYAEYVVCVEFTVVGCNDHPFTLRRWACETKTFGGRI
jgi:hypothetical protein